jgi:hypothetical protein
LTCKNSVDQGESLGIAPVRHRPESSRPQKSWCHKASAGDGDQGSPNRVSAEEILKKKIVRVAIEARTAET